MDVTRNGGQPPARAAVATARFEPRGGHRAMGQRRAETFTAARAVPHVSRKPTCRTCERQATITPTQQRELTELLTRGRIQSCVPRIVSICERQSFAIEFGGGTYRLARFVPTQDVGDLVLEVLVHSQSLATLASAQIQVFAAGMAELSRAASEGRGQPSRGGMGQGSDDWEVFVADDAAATVTLTEATPNDKLLLGGALTGTFGEGVAIFLVGVPGPLGTCGDVELTVRLVLREAAPPKPLLEGDTQVLGELVVGDGVEASRIAVRAADASDGKLSFEASSSGTAVERWRLARVGAGSLTVERFDSSGVTQDTPLSISATEGLVTGRMLHTTVVAYTSASTSKIFVNFTGTSTNTTLSTTTPYARWIAPGAGRLREVRLICSGSAGSTKVCFHANNDTSSATNREVTVSITANTVATFDFSGKSTSFSAGDRLSVSVDPTNAANETTVICVWELVL